MLFLTFAIFLLNISMGFCQLFECPFGWQRGEFCGGIFCYFKLAVPPLQRPTAVEQNICLTAHPSAHVVSIHCSQEMQFLAQFGKFVTGLHIRSTDPWTKNGFRWEDGSPLDFDGWDHGIPDQPDNQLPPERNVEFRTNLQRFGWHDLPLIFFEALVCKITIRAYGQLPLTPQNPLNPGNPGYPIYQYPYSPYQYQYRPQTPAPQFHVATPMPPIYQPFAAQPVGGNAVEILPVVQQSPLPRIVEIPVVASSTLPPLRLPPPPSSPFFF